MPAETARRLACDCSVVTIIEDAQGQPLDDGAWRFCRPDGESLVASGPNHTRPLGDWLQLVAVHEKQSLHIDAHTARTRWRGESMDYGLAIEVLRGRERRGV
jgi:hypothetical protein